MIVAAKYTMLFIVGIEVGGFLSKLASGRGTWEDKACVFIMCLWFGLVTFFDTRVPQ